ncbi:MAG TPA: hypothetical protein IAC21_04805 [Candidatus Enterenecus merdae]|nr:hypothetical protein [Candidatus Enterenecus merdae]
MNPLPQTLSHAYLVTGGSQASRGAYALRLAQAYLCQGERPPCGVCLPCRKAAAGVHPDLIRLTPEEGKREIGVDQARALRADLYVRPNEGRRKVYLIDPADALNPPAQSALLKSLEEGPAYAAFLLLSGQPGLLLDTIRSRCEQLTLPPEEEPADPQQLQKGARLAQLLLEGDELAVAEGLAALEQEKLSGGQLLDLLAVAEGQAAQALAITPRRAAAVVRALKQCRDSGVYHPGGGHLLGALAARLFG